MAQKKWEIKGLRKKLIFQDAAVKIVSERLNQLNSSIGDFLEEKTVENLHQVRIALRRVRYNMELFTICFDKKIFLIFYKRIELLQDFSGKVRDLDVMKENILLLSKNDKVEISEQIKSKLSQRRERLNNTFILELMKFNHSKALKSFSKLLSKVA
jgi:CHAD domain-containing protein